MGNARNLHFINCILFLKFWEYRQLHPLHLNFGRDRPLLSLLKSLPLVTSVQQNVIISNLEGLALTARYNLGSK